MSKALIEVNIVPQKDLGFDKIAERIYLFPEVTNCYLISGTYDLLVVEGKNMHTVSNLWLRSFPVWRMSGAR